MNDTPKNDWSKSFLEQEESIDDLARMASIAETLCFSTFGESTSDNGGWEDALFTIRHLVTMIDEFRADYLAALGNGASLAVLGKGPSGTDSPVA
jgi:hypothetical protein